MLYSCGHVKKKLLFVFHFVIFFSCYCFMCDFTMSHTALQGKAFGMVFTVSITLVL